MRDLTTPEQRFLKEANNRLTDYVTRVRSFPVRTSYPTEACWTVFSIPFDLITDIGDVVNKHAESAKLLKYQSRLLEITSKAHDSWTNESPLVQPYQRALLIAKGAAAGRDGIKKASSMVTFPDDRFLPTMLAKSKIIASMLSSFTILLMNSDDLDSESMMYDLVYALNKVYTKAGRSIKEAAKDIVKGSAGAAGLIAGAFIKTLWKPAALAALAYLIWKKLDRGTWSLKGSDESRLASQATQARLQAARATAALRSATTKTTP